MTPTCLPFNLLLRPNRGNRRVFCAVGVLVGYIFALSRIFRYSLNEGVLKIRMLGLTMRRIRLSTVEKIQVISCLDTVPFSKSFRPSLLFAQRWGGYKAKEISIETRRGLIKRLIISPEDPDAFVSQLEMERQESLSSQN